MESSRACLFLAILASASTLTLSAKSDIVVVLTCYAGFEDRIAAGRASRQAQGLKLVVVTNEMKEDRQHLREAANETWVLHEGGHLEDLSAFTAFKALGASFDWMLVGEDDTLFFREGAETAVREADKKLPYMISDTAWFISHEGVRHYLKAEAPQCVPCGYSKDLGSLPKHFTKGCPCTVSNDPPTGSCGPNKMPSMEYFPHGGSGYLLSLALLQKVSLEDMRQCLSQEGDHDLIGCLWKSGIGITDPDPTWHPEGLTHFDPTPAPFLTHENVMEKLSHTLGSLLRAATGMCTDICQAEVKHLVSIHVNAVRIGFTREGEKRVGNFKDPGQREFCGQQLLAAVSRFVAAGSGGGDSELKELERRADARLASAARMIGGMGSIFQEDVLGEGMDAGKDGTQAKLSTMEQARSAIAASIARQALDIILQDCTGGTAI